IPRSGIIAAQEERTVDEQTPADGIRRVLRELHIESSGLRYPERSRVPAIANAAVVLRAERARREFPVCRGKVDGEGSSRAHHGYRADFYLPGIALRARRSNAASRLRTK